MHQINNNITIMKESDYLKATNSIQLLTMMKIANNLISDEIITRGEIIDLRLCLSDMFMKYNDKI